MCEHRSSLLLGAQVVLLWCILGVVASVNAQSHQPSQCIPPLQGSYVPPPGAHSWGHDQTWAATNMEHKAFSNCFPPPPPGGSQDHEFDSLMDAQITTNRGASYMWVRANARCRVHVTHTGSSGGTQHYETEMLQLDISGGGLPPGVAIRESPTNRSSGQLTIQPAPGGGYNVNSFFDVWTDLTIDGGASWLPSTSAAHMVLTSPSPEFFSPTQELPVRTSRYISARGFSAPYANGIIISNIFHYGFTASQPPPGPGGTVTHSFNSQLDFQVSTDGGATFVQHRAPANTVVRVTGMTDSEGTKYLETEMLQLNIAGGTLPPQIRVRETPSQPSLGRTHIRPVPGGSMIGSYFDIFTDVSTDNGLTWSPALCPHPVRLDGSYNKIPTVSEWGLIIMALLFLTVASIFIGRSHIPGMAANGFPLVASLFVRVLAAAVLLWLACVITIAATLATISTTDVVGSLISTVIGAYWVHLLVARPKAQVS
jgi:exosortase sorting signal-containing protein